MKCFSGKQIAAMSTVLAGMLAGAALCAQAPQSITLNETDVWHGRPFLLALRPHGLVEQTNWWHPEGGIQDYAKAHPDESYLLFVQGSILYRLDTAAELSRLQEQHQSLESLGSIQSALAVSMAPLSAQQQALSMEMRATHDPHLMGRIGHEQGVIGARQGEIGRQQGIIGRQQGILGRAFYQSTQETIDRCLMDRSCYAVAPAAPASAQR